MERIRHNPLIEENSFERFLLETPKPCGNNGCPLCKGRFDKALKIWIKNERVKVSKMTDEEIVLTGMKSLRESFMLSCRNTWGNKIVYSDWLINKIFYSMDKSRFAYKTAESLLAIEGFGSTVPLALLSETLPSQKEFNRSKNIRYKEVILKEIKTLEYQVSRAKKKRLKLMDQLERNNEKDKRSRERSAYRQDFINNFIRTSSTDERLELLLRFELPFEAFPEKLVPVEEINNTSLTLMQIECLIDIVDNRKGNWNELTKNLKRIYREVYKKEFSNFQKELVLESNNKTYSRIKNIIKKMGFSNVF
tara:strand:+ start:2619 stop:3539 length:921 start_codon:yes stop_codon:yes gene_type:complete